MTGEAGIVSGMAGRYATALFELALEERALDKVKADLETFDALIAANPDLDRLVRSPVFGWEPSNDWFYDPAQGGGVILDTLVHFGDLVLWLFGPAEHVHTEGGPYKLEGAKRHGSPDNAVVTVRHVSGAVSSMYVTWTAGHGNFRLDVYGTEGAATVDFVKAQALETHSIADGWDYPDLLWSYGYGGEQQYFVDRILGREDGTKAATAAEARDALALMLAAQQSLDERRTVELPTRGLGG